MSSSNTDFVGYDQNVTNYLQYNELISLNYTDISNAISQHTAMQNALMKNPIYDYSGNTLKLPGNKTPTMLDAVTQDAGLLVLQENTIYIIGSITMATFLILALMIGSEP